MKTKSKSKPLPSKELLDELLVADFETGKLYWKDRDAKWFKNPKRVNCWNVKFAKKEAFTALAHGYFHGSIFSSFYFAHRILYKMYYGFDPNYIDHINGDRNDNRIQNLRSVTNQENGKNQRMRSTNTTGTQGVYWEPRRNNWQSRIKFNGKFMHLGNFQDKEDAIKARKEAEIKYGFHPNHGRTE